MRIPLLEVLLQRPFGGRTSASCLKRQLRPARPALARIELAGHECARGQQSHDHRRHREPLATVHPAPFSPLQFPWPDRLERRQQLLTSFRREFQPIGPRAALRHRRRPCLAHQSDGLFQPVVQTNHLGVLGEDLLERRRVLRGQFPEEQRGEPGFQFLAGG